MRKVKNQIIALLLGVSLAASQPGMAGLTYTSQAAGQGKLLKAEAGDYIKNGSFEDGSDGLEGWEVTGTGFDTKTADFHEGTKSGHFWNEAAATYLCTQTISSLPAGTYKLSLWSMGGDGETVYPYFDGNNGEDVQKDAGWGNWKESVYTVTTKEEKTNVKVGFYIEAEAGGWGNVDSVSFTAADASAVTPTKEPDNVKPVDSDIYVERIKGLDENFIKGADISSILSEYQSGVKYYDFSGKELKLEPASGEKGFFDFLKETGLNWVRIRVWNNPYDKDGKSYGGGSNDIATAKKIGKLATDAGLRVLIDFHYSDFWADPNMQGAPKAWESMDIEAKKKALADYTTESMKTLLDAGVDVGMVQVGNETVNGFAGEKVQWTTDAVNVCALMNAGSKAVRDIAKSYNKEIMVALHFTNVQDAGYYDNIAAALDANKVDYDVFATSYYPFWHGNTSTLTSVMKKIAGTYGKKAMVAETSYAYTLEDGDGHENNVNPDATGLTFNYTVSVQGQANAVADVIEAVHNIGDAGIGMFYWEPAWIPVNVYDKNAADAASVLENNKSIWEKNGSGWASSYSKEYDPDNAGLYYGGSSWDNQAMFDFTGHPLESANVYKYVDTGTTKEVTIESVENITYTIAAGAEFKLPETVPAKYIDNSTKEVAVTWSESDINSAKDKGVGTYDIKGTVSLDGKSFDVTCKVTVRNPNLILNPGFEEEDMGMWTITGEGAGREADSNKRTGDYSLKYWSDKPISFTAEQKITLNKGKYNLSAYTQGAVSDNGQDAVYELYAVVNGNKQSDFASVTSWQEWDQAALSFEVTEDNTEVTIGVNTSANANGWGSWDDFDLSLAGDAGNNNNSNNNGDNSNNGKEPSVQAPGKVTLKKVTAGKKKFTVTWKKVSGADGYRVVYSTSSKFNGSKKVNIKSAKTTSRTVKKLKSGKKYYVKVRAYTKDGSKNVYGSFSKVMKVKVK